MAFIKDISARHTMTFNILFIRSMPKSRSFVIFSDFYYIELLL